MISVKRMFYQVMMYDALGLLLQLLNKLIESNQDMLCPKNFSFAMSRFLREARVLSIQWLWCGSL